jgi:hypothetical protein
MTPISSIRGGLFKFLAVGYGLNEIVDSVDDFSEIIFSSRESLDTRLTR